MLTSDSKFNEIIVEGSGQIVKMEVDCSAVVDEKLPVAQKLAKENKLAEALDVLLGLEKQARTGSDMHSSCKILVTIVQLCYEVKNFKTDENYSCHYELSLMSIFCFYHVKAVYHKFTIRNVIS